MPRIRATPPPATGSSGGSGPARGLPLLGTWAAGEAYEAGDVVVRGTRLWRALGASTGDDPAAVPSLVQSAEVAHPSPDIYGALRQYQTLTTTAALTVAAVAVRAGGPPVPAGTVVGLADALAAVDVWRAQAVLGAQLAGGEWSAPLPLDAPVSLAAGAVVHVGTVVPSVGSYQAVGAAAGATATGPVTLGPGWAAGAGEAPAQIGYRVLLRLYAPATPSPWVAL